MNRPARRCHAHHRRRRSALVDGGLIQARNPLHSTPKRPSAPSAVPTFSVRYQTVKVDGLEIFYREAGPKDAPVILLLHGFPTSSHMFRNLIPALADKFRVIAPDYPGFGNSSMPSPSEFEYSFDNLAKVVDEFTEAVGARAFALYVQDYGAPIGFRIASAHPERITGLIIQNGNAYEEGLRDFWVPFKAYWKEQSAENEAALTPFFEIGATKWQWTHGVKDPSTDRAPTPGRSIRPGWIAPATRTSSWLCS